MNLIDSIQMEDLDEEQQQMAELIGLDNFKKLVQNYGGTCPYIPKPDGVGKFYRNERIRAEFSGYNFRELATKYALTEVTIRNIVSDLVKPIRRRPPEDQISFYK